MLSLAQIRERRSDVPTFLTEPQVGGLLAGTLAAGTGRSPLMLYRL